MKQRTVFYQPEAADDLDWIYGVVADAAGPVVAFGYERRIREFCEGLDLASERGQARDEVRPCLRIIGFERRVTVAFVVEGEAVHILRVFYGGADWESAL